VPAPTLVVVNPHSRAGATGRRFAAVEASLRAALGPLEVEATRGPRDAERIAREAVRAGVSRLVVAGGDGTTSEVVTGLLAAGLGGYAQLGILPLGTGGDLVRTLGVPRDVAAAIAALAAGKTRQVDAGRARFRNRDGRERETFFLNVASVGVSGLVCELVNSGPKRLGGRIAFLLGTLRALARWRERHVEIRVDGELAHDGPLTLATAANGCWFGGGMNVAPRAEPDDGLLDVVSLGGVSKLQLLLRMPRLYRGTHLSAPSVKFTRGRLVEARPVGEAEIWVEIDGEPLGTLPARFEVVPGAITLFGVGA
jgi:YegS/Rv2252/BmrU family lipid kinase